MKIVFTIFMVVFGGFSCKARQNSQLNDDTSVDGTSGNYTVNNLTVTNESVMLPMQASMNCKFDRKIDVKSASSLITIRNVFVRADSQEKATNGFLSPDYWRKAVNPKDGKPIFENVNVGTLQTVKWQKDKTSWFDAIMRNLSVGLNIGIGVVTIPLNLYVRNDEERIEVIGSNEVAVKKALFTVINPKGFSADLQLDPVKFGDQLQGYLMNGSVSVTLSGIATKVPQSDIKEYTMKLWPVFLQAINDISGTRCTDDEDDT